MNNKFFTPTSTRVSSRLNKYMKENFGYEVQGDLKELRAAKARLQEMANSGEGNYVETSLMLQTVDALIKAHSENLGEGWGKKKVTEAAYPPRFAFINNDEEIEIWNNIAKRHIRSIPMQNKQAAIRRLEQANYKASLDTFKGYQMWYMNTEHGVRFSDYDPELEEAAKPDFLDLDKDGNKKEPMKKAAKDAKKKSVEEGMNFDDNRDGDLKQIAADMFSHAKKSAAKKVK